MNFFLPSQSKHISLIKLGGSIITDKKVPDSFNQPVLARLIAEIVKAQQKTHNIYIIGHGAGSFAHVPATKYQTMKGFINQNSRYGMAVTQDSAAIISRLVVKECLAQQLPAVTYALSNTLVTTQQQEKSWSDEVFFQYLHSGLTVVTHGDVIVDTQQGCTIWSTEQIFTFLVEKLIAHQYQVDKVTQVGDVAGVLDNHQQTIPQIQAANFLQLKSVVKKTNGYDVTGGMMHKLAESFKIAQLGVSSQIISGLKENNLYNVLTNKSFTGTTVV